ncbi:MAG TPA: hypothetical protein PLI09_04835 [Candidatus Hydrogenedentes bacterium]|nr:hypothetical protein [Candidatus Hydrogenedentota bacterium]
MQRRTVHHLALVGILASGIVLRLAQYLHNREFWYDEACLAVAILQQPFSGLIGPLEAGTFPIGFLGTVKLVTLFAGGSEYALRLVPLLAGILSLGLFAGIAWRMAKHQDSKDNPSVPASDWGFVLIAMAFFAFSKHLIYYSSEVRHYALDVLAVCIAYFIALRLDGPKKSMYMAIFGVVVLWYSLAAVFVLAGIGMVDLIESAWKRQRRVLLCTLAWGIPCGLSFLIHMYIFRMNVTASDLGDLFAQTCAYLSVPIPPRTAEDIRVWREFLTHFVSFPGGLTTPLLALMACMIGILSLWIRARRVLFLLLVPGGLVMAASALHQYPFRNQYILFLVPSFLLVIAEGVNAVRTCGGIRWSVTAMVLLSVLLARPVVQSMKVLVEARSGPGGVSEIKPLLRHVQENWQEGDVLYVADIQRVCFEYYRPHFGYAPATVPIDAAPGVKEKDAFTLTTRGIGDHSLAPKRFWLLHQGHGTYMPFATSEKTKNTAVPPVEREMSASSTLEMYTVENSTH